jgi:competence protein ComEC
MAPMRLVVLVPGLLGVVVGSALQIQQPTLWTAAGYAATGAAGVALALGALSWRATSRPRRAFFLVLVALALAVFALCGSRSLHYARTALNPALEGQDIMVTGTVAGLPEAMETGVRFRLQVDSASLQGKSLQVPPLIDLAWYHEAGASGAQPRQAGAPHAGERWRMVVRLKAPHGARNPNGFDYELRQWEQGVQAVGYVRAGPKDGPPARLDAALRYPVLQLREQVRDAILTRLAAAAEGPAEVRAAGVVAALVTGDQRAIDRSDWNVFRATGVAHLVSISGLHITLFAWLAALAVGGLWRRAPRLCLAWPAQSAALLGGLLLATVYAVFSGWGIPAQRTVLMLAVVVGLKLAGRRWPWPLIWLMACAVVVLFDPWALLQAGFWLSFVAVGVLFALNPIAGSAGTISAKAKFLSLLREQWTVTVALTPLSLLLFGQVSLVGFFANLVAIPWVTLIVTPLAFAGVLWPPLWRGAAWCVQLLGIWLGWLAAWPWAQFDVAAAPLWAGLAAVIGGVLLAARLPASLRLAGVPLLLPALLWQAPRPPPGSFELLAADIGQGNAVLVRTARHALLYDTGPRYSLASDAGDRVLVPLLRSLGERVDTVMLSHRDSDHTGGASAVLAQQPQAALTGSIAGEAALLALRAWAPCVAGQTWTWDGVQFDVLHPLQAAPAVLPRGEKPNAQSCVLHVRAVSGASALLVGDIERPQELALVEAGAPLAADALLVPHHGSKTSSSDAFLVAVQPKIALVQAAYRSRFGHPAPIVVQRLREHGARVVDSAHCGAATWQSDAPEAVRCEREVGRRYWQHDPP